MREGRILGIDDEFFHDQGGYVRTHAATVPDLAAAMLPGPVSRAGLSGARSCPADQQDAGRHLSGARPLREHVRARAADGRDRGSGSESTAIEVRRRNLIAKERDAVSRGRSRRWAPTSCSIPATMPACSTRRSPPSSGMTLQDDLRRRRAAGECVGAGLAIFVEKSGLGPFDGVRLIASTVRRLRRGRHRRGVGRAGRRDGGGANLRRCARCRLSRACASCMAAPTGSRSGRAPSPRASR